jgi:hypothetical protein
MSAGPDREPADSEFQTWGGEKVWNRSLELNY